MTIDADRLRTLVAELDQLLATPGQQAAVLPNGLPGPVAAGELIESAWGNAVSTSMTMVNEKRPYCKFMSAGTLVQPSVNQALTCGPGATSVVDPNNMLGPNGGGLTIPAGWGGLWHFTAAFNTGTHINLGEVAFWFSDPGGARYSSIQAIEHAQKAQILGASATIPAAAGALIQLYCYQMNGSAITAAAQVTATWVGKYP